MSAGSEESEESADGPSSRLALFASLAVFAVLAVLVLTVDPLRSAVSDAIHGDTASLRQDLRDLGAGGVLIVLALALVHALVLYPAEILDAAAGFAYGFWLALPLMMLGWLLNGIVCHQVGRYAARPALLRLLGERRVERYEAAVARGGVTLLLGMRMVPFVPFSLFSYVAGSAEVPLRTFIWTTLVGYLPITLLFVLLGSRLKTLSATDPVVLGGALALIVMLLVTRKVMPMLGVEEP